jgi:hypothetical protein
MFTLLLLSMFVLVGLSIAGSWEIDRIHPVSSVAAPANQLKTGTPRGEQPRVIDETQAIRNLIAAFQGLSLIACGATRPGVKSINEKQRSSL